MISLSQISFITVWNTSSSFDDFQLTFPLCFRFVFLWAFCLSPKTFLKILFNFFFVVGSPTPLLIPFAGWHHSSLKSSLNNFLINIQSLRYSISIAWSRQNCWELTRGRQHLCAGVDKTFSFNQTRGFEFFAQRNAQKFLFESRLRSLNKEQHHLSDRLSIRQCANWWRLAKLFFFLFRLLPFFCKLL